MVRLCTPSFVVQATASTWLWWQQAQSDRELPVPALDSPVTVQGAPMLCSTPQQHYIAHQFCQFSKPTHLIIVQQALPLL